MSPLPGGWQVTLCDPIWHVSSSSGVSTSVSELLYPCYFTLLYCTFVLAGSGGFKARRPAGSASARPSVAGLRGY